MKIGGYTRAVHDFAQAARISQYDVRTLLALGDVMWMGIDEMQYVLVAERRSVVRSLKTMKEKGFIKVSRTENSFKGLCRMYSITQKGRDLIREFINHLK